ncbi:MAG: hypothetical protein AAF500_00400 [Myxococcota bacterium]
MAWLTRFGEIVDASAGMTLQNRQDAFIRRHLGVGVARVLFVHHSVGRTYGLELEDDRKVVLKERVSAPGHGGVSFDRDALEQVVRIQRYLHDRGYPAPEPLVGPQPFGEGLATVERYLDRGRVREGQDPAVRTALAREVFKHTQLLQPFVEKTTLSHFGVPRDRLFPTPYDPNVRPLNRGVEVDWVFQLATRARSIATSTISRPVVAHQDFRVEHARFEREDIVATFDWDSIAVGPEVRLVGANAHGFSGDWSQDVIRRVPTHETILGFIEDYEHARGAPFSIQEHRAVRAWAVYWIAYGAWLFIERGQTDWPDDSWPALLSDCGGALLR